MSKLIINGGIPLRGKIKPTANKNSIMKLIPATILVDAPVRFTNFPKTKSTKVMLSILSSLGAKVEYFENNEILIDSRSVNSFEVDDELASLERSSLMFLGPLVSRFGKASVSDSGGCKLGVRPLDTMFQGLKSLGVEISGSKKYELRANSGLIGNPMIWLLEASVTGTENLILAAVKAKGRTVIYEAACEPHTQDLCNFLNLCGAKISGVGSNRLTIDGVDKLGESGGEVKWNIISDHIDIGGLIIAAAITGGEVEIEDAIPEHMTQILNYFGKVNLKTNIVGNSIFVPKDQDLRCLPNFKGDLDKIPDKPWPGFPVDLIPQAVVLASFAPGNLRVHSFMYETQLFFVEELMKLNAKVHLANPHTVITLGPSKFRPGKINCPDIIQAAHALIIAALAAEGETTLNNVDHVFRRYPDILTEFTSLGAKMEVIV
jgi:UDP-N-acetylglucosamine 1-carboxyvinyltransferase